MRIGYYSDGKNIVTKDFYRAGAIVGTMFTLGNRIKFLKTQVTLRNNLEKDVD